MSTWTVRDGPMTYDVIDLGSVDGEKKVGVITFDDSADRTSFFQDFVKMGFEVRIEKDGSVVLNTGSAGHTDTAKYVPTKETK